MLGLLHAVLQTFARLATDGRFGSNLPVSDQVTAGRKRNFPQKATTAYIRIPDIRNPVAENELRSSRAIQASTEHAVRTDYASGADGNAVAGPKMAGDHRPGMNHPCLD